MSKHRGEIVKQKCIESGIALNTIAQKMGRNRGTLYNWFEKADLDIDSIVKIGQIIRHDFSEELPELFRAIMDPMAPSSSRSQELMRCEHERDTWKEKYFELLEQHNMLLTGRLSEFFRSVKV